MFAPRLDVCYTGCALRGARGRHLQLPAVFVAICGRGILSSPAGLARRVAAAGGWGMAVCLAYLLASAPIGYWFRMPRNGAVAGGAECVPDSIQTPAVRHWIGGEPVMVVCEPASLLSGAHTQCPRLGFWCLPGWGAFCARAFLIRFWRPAVVRSVIPVLSVFIRAGPFGVALCGSESKSTLWACVFQPALSVSKRAGHLSPDSGESESPQRLDGSLFGRVSAAFQWSGVRLSEQRWGSVDFLTASIPKQWRRRQHC